MNKIISTITIIGSTFAIVFLLYFSLTIVEENENYKNSF